jgi:uncharacterized protein
MKNKRLQKTLLYLQWTAAIYSLLCLLLWWLHPTILFRGEPLSQNYQYQFKQPFIEKTIVYNKETSFNLVQFLRTDSTKSKLNDTIQETNSKGVVLYFHGNRTNINRYAPFSNFFTNNGFEVWIPDYPGYGKSYGKLTEAILYKEAEQVYKMALSKFQPHQIVIYGKSLGTGIAAWLAARKPCKALVLETPYYSFASVVQRFFPIFPTGLINFLPINIYPVQAFPSPFFMEQMMVLLLTAMLRN